MPRTLRDGTRLHAPQRESRTRALRSGPRDYNSRSPGVCPSGQRERAVNPSAQPTEVRILPPPLTPARSPASAPAEASTRAARALTDSHYGVRMAHATAEVMIVPASAASWEDLQAVLGTRGEPSR